MLTTTLHAKEFLVYFGTYTNAVCKGIYVSRLDADTGNLSAPNLATITPDPSFLAFSPDEKFVYVANEFGGRNHGAVTAFSVDKKTGRLLLCSLKDPGGSAPCHVSVDATGKTLFVANYNSGTIKSISLNADGTFGDGGSLIRHQGRSLNPDRQAGPHAHFATVDPSNRFVLACDLGLDKVMIYRFDAANSTLVANDPPFASVPPGSGVRHLVFSHDGKRVYAINEMACTVSTFDWDAAKGELTPGETVSALPADVAVQPNYSGAEILMHPSGKFVYATVRGHGSITVFSVDAKTGHLTFVQNVPAGGKVPRGFGIDPTGRWLIAANQNTGKIVEFAIDAATGQLTPTKTVWRIGSAVDVKFVQAD